MAIFAKIGVLEKGKLRHSEPGFGGGLEKKQADLEWSACLVLSALLPSVEEQWWNRHGMVLETSAEKALSLLERS